MDAYEQIRIEARDKRDRAIKSARAEYQSALRRINELRRQLTGEAPVVQPKRDGQMTRRIMELLPTEGTFTICDFVEKMHADSIGRHYAANSIRSAFVILKRTGVARQVGRRNGHVLWAAQAANVDASPFGGATLADIAEQLIRELGPMRVREIVVVMKERGHRQHEKDRDTASAVLRAINRFSGRFVKQADGRWAVAKSP
jgi:hypothetical protein